MHRVVKRKLVIAITIIALLTAALCFVYLASQPVHVHLFDISTPIGIR